MLISFRAFRKILLGTTLLLHATSLVLSIYLRPSFIHPNSAYFLVGILDCFIVGTIIVLAKPLFGCSQSVATEILFLFILLPFSLILSLYVLSLVIIPDSAALWIFAILQILVFIGTILRKPYPPTSDGQVRFGSGSGYFFPNPEPELRFRFSNMLNPEPEPAVQVQSGSVQRSGAFERRTEPKFSQSLNTGRKSVLPLEIKPYLQDLQIL
ncbi:hypothetical protein DFH06DRAFT_201228 [Mycena polygramma]|nr:hypothetical protein DFH06DRAFT_201228 [Mycena polygramma]